MLRVYHASALPLMGRRGGDELSAYRREKLASIRNPEAYARSLGAELLLRAALKDLGLPTEEPLAVVCDGAGKPRLARGPEFSLSHSGEQVICALSDQAVGADIQRLRPWNPALTRRFFTGEETTWLEGQREKDKAFSLLWSLKESYVKFLGSGIEGTRLTSFTVAIAPGGSARIAGSGVKLWYAVGGGYVMSTCSAADAVPESVEERSLYY